MAKKKKSCKLEDKHLLVLDFFYNIREKIETAWDLCIIFGMICLFFVCIGLLASLVASIIMASSGEQVPLWMATINYSLALIGVIVLFFGWGHLTNKLE